jgi:hypothetical protein
VSCFEVQWSQIGPKTLGRIIAAQVHIINLWLMPPRQRYEILCHSTFEVAHSLQFHLLKKHQFVGVLDILGDRRDSRLALDTSRPGIECHTCQ